MLASRGRADGGESSQGFMRWWNWRGRACGPLRASYCSGGSRWRPRGRSSIDYLTVGGRQPWVEARPLADRDAGPESRLASTRGGCRRNPQELMPDCHTTPSSVRVGYAPEGVERKRPFPILTGTILPFLTPVWRRSRLPGWTKRTLCQAWTPTSYLCAWTLARSTEPRITPSWPVFSAISAVTLLRLFSNCSCCKCSGPQILRLIKV